MTIDQDPIVVEAIYGAPSQLVWRAITEPDRMRQWFFEAIADFAPEVGFETQFDVRNEEKIYRHVWKVTEVDPGKRIVYQWRYDGIPGNSRVIWELADVPEGMRLTLTHEVLDPFPQDDPSFTRESGLAGWSYFLHERLTAFLKKRDA